MKLLLANFKNKLGVEDTISLVSALDLPEAKESHAIGLAASSMALPSLASEETGILIASQNVGWSASHALTGETMPQHLIAYGIRLCIIGHSERRLYLNETEEIVTQRLGACLTHGIKPILCIGETLGERDADQTNDVLARQLCSLQKAFQNTGTSPARDKFLIAYEPMWAISTSGSNQTLSAKDANKIHKEIRDMVEDLIPSDERGQTSILYGGSVNAENCGPYFQQNHIDGALVGSGMLSIDGFGAVAESYLQNC